MRFSRDDMDRFCRYIEYLQDGIAVDGVEVVDAIPTNVPETISIMRATLTDGRVLAMIKPGSRLMIAGSM